ncbi:MAG: Hsp20/alpha crystallin family protein [Candidatus Lokiarchaeota archaeon]|nr:Hsp20/alpha crystallin family protein [Candidatus Lokiarchaeota archaeon]
MNKKINSCIQVNENFESACLDDSGKSVVSPRLFISTMNEFDGLTLDYTLPGVDKEAIELKISEDSIFVKGETDSIHYSSFYRFTCPVTPNDVKASYDNGLLRIKVPFKDITLDMIDIDIK